MSGTRIGWQLALPILDEIGEILTPPSLKEMIDACQLLEEGGLLVCTDALDFVEAACQFRGR
ncbi:MAG TPA: hypothetical protein VMR98_01035, partial [Candidatus Polarisedimenticolaceae bacterium]|nr:hypothetical protein [Candidatus Polarisedimenticolaceae bacterium]